MSPRVRVKALVVVCVLLLGAYVLIPRLGGQSEVRQLSKDTGQPQEGVRAIQQPLAPQSGANAVAQNPLVQQGTGVNQGIPQQGVVANQGIPQQGVVANQGIPQQGGVPNQGIPQQGVVTNQGIPQQGGVVPNANNPQQGPPSNQQQPPQQASSNAIWVTGQLGLHPDVKIVPSYLPSDANMTSKVDCVPLPKSPREGVKICIYPTQEDIWVSGSLKANKLWEQGLILSMLEALKANPDMMLLDLGCNLGLYAIFAAILGRSVLAVEMLPQNVLMVQRSLQMNGLSDQVLIVNNALYRDHRTLETLFMARNVGGSRLNTSKVYENIDKNQRKVSVRTICMDDLIPLLKGRTVFMKIDIENSEHHALACAHQLFADVNIKIVQIEWLHRTQEEITLISNFMTQHNYALSKSALTYVPLNSGQIQGADVYFLKKTSYNIS